MKVIPKRTFLLKQEHLDGGKVKDVIARKGELIDVSEKEYKKFEKDFAKHSFHGSDAKKKY
jgi:hypothetical protein